MESKDAIVLRRANDYQFIERLSHLEEKVNLSQESQYRLENELDTLRHNIESTILKLNNILEIQQSYKPVVDSFSKVISAGVVIRWMIIFIIGTLAAIGTASTALEVIQKWIR